MSPVGKEMHYKSGMKKDADGFTDIDWCSSAVLNTWDDLRKVFRAANARKAIAPTQVWLTHWETGGDGDQPLIHSQHFQIRHSVLLVLLAKRCGREYR